MGGVNVIIVNTHLAAHLEEMAERIEVLYFKIVSFVCINTGNSYMEAKVHVFLHPVMVLMLATIEHFFLLPVS